MDNDNSDNILSHFEIDFYDSDVETNLFFDKRNPTKIDQYGNSKDWTLGFVIVGADQSMAVLDEYVLGLGSYF